MFCVLGTSTHALQNGDITVTDGDVWFNGSITMNPQGSVTSANGTTYIQGNANPLSQVAAPRQTGAAAVTDPLAGSVTLPPAGLAALTLKTDPCTQGPGIYGAVSLSGNGTCMLSAGLYAFTDTFTIGGSRAVAGTGVTLYFTCGSSGVRASSCAGDSSPGTLDASGGNGVTISAPTSGPLAGLVMVFDRDNTATLSLQGGAGNAVNGTIYAPAASMAMGGNGCGAASHTMVVVYDFTLNGNNACFSTSYQGTNNVTIVGDTGLVL